MSKYTYSYRLTNIDSPYGVHAPFSKNFDNPRPFDDILKERNGHKRDPQNFVIVQWEEGVPTGKYLKSNLVGQHPLLAQSYFGEL